ncbi:hypothetical protein Hanom_Chr12g01144341 [Helianthus anomalus]
MVFHTCTFINASTFEGCKRNVQQTEASSKKHGVREYIKDQNRQHTRKTGTFVIDRFNQRDMVIKLNVGNIEVNKNVVSGLLGLRNGGVVLNYQGKESKKGRSTDKTKKNEKNEETNEHNED